MRIKKVNQTTATVKLYGNIGTWFQNANDFTKMLEDVEALGYHDLIIHEHCFGGSVFEGNVIYNALQRSNLNITIIIDGVAASMGMFILPAVKNVEICENAFGMIHRPQSNSGGNADDHLNEAKLLKSMEQNFIKRMTERSGLSEKEVKEKWLDGGDHWLNADEMVQYGFASKIIPATAKNIKDLDKQIVTNMGVENVYDRFAAHLQSNFNFKDNKKMDKSKIIADFSLQGVTAESSEAEILAALKSKFSTMENENKQLKQDANSKHESEVEAILKSLPENMYNESERKELKEIGMKMGVNALRIALKKPEKPQIPDITSLVQSEGKQSSVKKDWKWYQENNPQALEGMPKQNPEEFKEIYKDEFGVYPEM